jgi:hypothetical protein
MQQTQFEKLYHTQNIPSDGVTLETPEGDMPIEVLGA